MNETGKQINIKIKCTDSSITTLSVSTSQTVHDLKQVLSEVQLSYLTTKKRMSIPEANMRLIYKGRLLKDPETLQAYKIEDDHVVHLVTNSIPPANAGPEPPSESLESELELMQHLIQAITGLERRNRRLMFQQNAQSRTHTSSYYKKKTIEMMKQNIGQVETLISRRNTLNPPLAAGPQRPFKLENPTFTLGQWVDVKDTIGQWLEAQITKMQPDHVFVHFNGWGSRWDEWIDKNSPRIAPFRTYTIQSPQTPFLSPYPHIDPDAEDHEIPPTTDSYEDLLIKYLMCSEQIREMIINYLQLHVKLSMQNKLVELCTQLEAQEESKEESKTDKTVSTTLSELTGKDIGSSKEEGEKQKRLSGQMASLSAQLAPLLDRMGRMMGDMAPHFASLAYGASSSQGDIIQFPRFPAAAAEQMPDRPSVETEEMECQIPLMPHAADIAGLVGLTERRERRNEPSMQGIVVTLANEAGANGNPRPELGIQTENEPEMEERSGDFEEGL